MRMIKLIIFDLTGVCFNLEEAPFLKDYVTKHNLDHDDFMELYDENLKKAEVGKGTGINTWERVLEKFNIKENPASIIKEMIETKKAFIPTLEFAKSLKNKYQVTYYTNYCKDYWDEILKRFDMNTWFDKGFVSYQIRVRKPAAEGFMRILKHFNVKPEETVFTDDEEYRLEQAKKLGINTIHFNNLKEFKKQLQKLGVDVDK